MSKMPISKVLGMLILSLGVASSANAFSFVKSSRHHLDLHNHDTPKTDDTTPTTAPEIDPAGAIGAFTLLSAGLVVIRGRRAGK